MDEKTLVEARKAMMKAVKDARNVLPRDEILDLVKTSLATMPKPEPKKGPLPETRCFTDVGFEHDPRANYVHVPSGGGKV